MSTNLDQIRRMEPGVSRVTALRAYVDAGEEKIQAARELRDQDIRALVAEHGVAETARLCSMSPNTVKVIARGGLRL